jgi:hypothetical protein
LVEIFNIDRLEVPVDVDDNGDGYGSLGCGNRDHDQTEKMAIKLIRIEKPVEYHKVDIDRIEDQFYGHQHGDQISSCQETVDADKEHQGTDNKK